MALVFCDVNLSALRVIGHLGVIQIDRKNMFIDERNLYGVPVAQAIVALKSNRVSSSASKDECCASIDIGRDTLIIVCGDNYTLHREALVVPYDNRQVVCRIPRFR